MSDFTPKPIPANNAPAPLDEPVMPPGANSPRWWIASLIFHAVLLAWLLLFSPVRVFEPSARPATRANAARAREVVEKIRETQAASIQENLRSMEEMRRQMDELERHKREQFTAFAQEMRKDVPARATEQGQSIAEAQAAILAALDQAAERAGVYVQTRAGAYFDDLRDAQKLAREKQTYVQQLQERTQGTLSLGDDRFAAALSAQDEATAAQELATSALDEAEKAREPARASRKRTAREGQIEHFTYEIKRAKNTIANAEADFSDLKKALAAAEAVVPRAQAFAEQALAKAAKENTPAAQAAAEAAKKVVTRAEQSVASAQKRLNDAPKGVESARKRLPEDEAKLAAILAQPEPTPVEPTPEDRKMIDLQVRARELQAAAQKAQEKASQAIAALRDLAPAKENTDALAAVDRAIPVEPVAPLAQVENMNLTQIYEAAVKTEAALTQSYRRLRAVDLAMIRRMPLGKAAQLAEVATPLRPDLGGALGSSVDSGEEAVAAREAVQNAKAEVGAMVRLASSMLSQARDLDRSKETGATVSTEDYKAQYDQWQMMEQLASEDAGWAQDLSAAMQSGNPNGADGGNGANGGPGGPGGPGSGGPGGSGQSGPGGPGGNMAGGPGAPGAPDGGGTTGGPQGNGGSGSTGMGVSGTSGPFGDGGTGSGKAGNSSPGGNNGSPGGNGLSGPGGFGQGGIAGASGQFARPDDVTDRVIPFAGRRVAARGPSANWFYADSWYILGPFDNTGRRNLDTKFPPETIIDLNASYPGKNGVPIRWEFYQSGTPNIQPRMDAYNRAVQNAQLSPDANYERNAEYVIYYAYTELWFEKECDLWVAIGSDDFSKVWIEDQLVWSSGKNLKAWRLNEGLRKVHFKQGINRVLYRVENGNSKTEFSLVVSLQP